MEISTSKFKLLESGSVVVPEDDYVEVNIDGARFRFVFSPNDINWENKDSGVSGTLKSDTDGEYLEIEVLNYNALFSSPSQILSVGKMDEKTLYVNFSVVPFNNGTKIKSRILLYSWYKDK